jgi:hypothetical protein
MILASLNIIVIVILLIAVIRLCILNRFYKRILKDDVLELRKRSDEIISLMRTVSLMKKEN